MSAVPSLGHPWPCGRAVRLATKEDAPAIRGLGEAAHLTWPSRPDFPLRKIVGDVADRLVSAPQRLAYVVETADGTIEGVATPSAKFVAKAPIGIGFLCRHPLAPRHVGVGLAAVLAEHWFESDASGVSIHALSEGGHRIALALGFPDAVVRARSAPPRGARTYHLERGPLRRWGHLFPT